MARVATISFEVYYDYDGREDVPADETLLDAYHDLLEYVEADERLSVGHTNVTLTLGAGGAGD